MAELSNGSFVVFVFAMLISNGGNESMGKLSPTKEKLVANSDGRRDVRVCDCFLSWCGSGCNKYRTVCLYYYYRELPT